MAWIFLAGFIIRIFVIAVKIPAVNIVDKAIIVIIDTILFYFFTVGPNISLQIFISLSAVELRYEPGSGARNLLSGL